MKKFVVTRRQILRGVGGYSLGLPFLPSLVPGRAYGADPVFTPVKRFVSFSTQHGALWPDQMYPDSATLTNTFAFKPGHDIKYGPLKGTVDGDYNQVSPILRASKSVLTDKMISKMNVLRGFDIPFYTGHQTGGHLGNFVANESGAALPIAPFSTIDQFMAWSPRFYSDLSTNKMRVIVSGEAPHAGSDSYVWSNPADKTSNIQPVPPDSSSLSLFGKLFVPATTGNPPPAKRKPIVDLVVANYRSLLQSNRRLSASDKNRLAAHISQLAEVQRKLNLNAPLPASCGSYTKPTADSTSAAFSFPNDGPVPASNAYHLINDVIAMAFACGTSRIATLHEGKIFSTNDPVAWHNDVAHQAAVPNNMRLYPLSQLKQTLGGQVPVNLGVLAAAGQATFEGAFLDLAAKLDAQVEDNAQGTTILDNTHAQWTQEAGWGTHNAQDMPIVVFGSAAGHFKTGQFVDFRNTAKARDTNSYGGIWVRQWLANVLQAMGIPPNEFEANGKTGYGDPYSQPYYVQFWHSDLINKASDLLPVITV